MSHPGLVNRGLESMQGLWKELPGFAGTIVTCLVLVRVHSWDLNILTEVKPIWHKINHFKVNNLVSFSTFTMLCYRHRYLVPKYFHYTKIKFVPIKHILSTLLLPGPDNHQCTFSLYGFVYSRCFI